ncbi:MAG TPA: PQQ-dependent sugar dehydrogenase [Planctomycetota bacterium]|nr:PQQ-dependent sugar dehydrogenase [Planctomycetota bacterium]
MNRIVDRSIALAALLMGAGACQAPPPSAKAPARPTIFECRWAETAPALDGRGDDPAWKDAEAIDNFHLPWLGADDRPAKTRTRAKLLWDREYLYFLAEMEDSDLYATIKEHNGKLWENDVFELFFKPAAAKPGYYEFQVNAAGATLELFFPRRGSGGFDRFRNDADFHLQASVKLDGSLNHWQDKDKGWTVEGRLPWRDFIRSGGRPQVDEEWSFALCRYDYSADFEGPELSTCAPLSQINFHQYEDYATLRFKGPALDRRPALTTSRVVGSPDPPLPYRVRPAFPDLKVPCPIAVAREPGTDSLILAHQAFAWGGAGRILRIQDTPGVKEAQELLQVDGIAYGVAFHPDYEKNGFLYVGSNGPLSSRPKKTRVTRYTVGRDGSRTIDPKSALLIIEWESDGHNGGDVAFGNDGMLYVTSGDGSSDSDTHLSGQDLTRLLAKVLRIDVDHPAAGAAYAVPADNPFLNVTGARPETWAYGFRNPWRITCDRATGDLWVGQNGQDLWEQAYLVRRGENYGWSVTEGGHPFYPTRTAGPTPITKPTVEHPHSEFRSLTGGIVYRGDAFPELRGAYIYGDWSTGRIWGAKQQQGKLTWQQELATSTLQITGFGADTKGEILICDHGGGAIYRLERTPPQKDAPLFPTKLSETGLFASVSGHQVDPALVPYSVNSPLWSDGAYKERFLALPGPEARIDVTTSRGWNFPDRTVVVKSFALDQDGDRRRWVETRLLTKQNGQWVGYSYLWNEEQTEATLVEAAGLDREFKVRGGRQTWHFPSRAECMMCHSRAANFVLGLTTLQMNRGDQLAMLERRGLLRVDWGAEAQQAIREETQARGLTGRALDDEVRRRTDTRDQRERASSSLLAYPPEHYGKLADPSDPKADLEARARSYLHANCSICHVEAGGGNALMELELTTAREKMNILGVKPLHDGFGLEGAKLVDPGHPERSVLLERISKRGTGQMPPLATSRVDDDAIRLIRDWIQGLK